MHDRLEEGSHGDCTEPIGTAHVRRAPGEPQPRRPPKILLLTDRAPGADSGYSIRVNNVINGLAQAGDLHVCLIDSSTGGMWLPVNAPYATSVVRARNLTRPMKALLAPFAIPYIPYRDSNSVRAKVRDAVGGAPWDLVWCSRARTHEISRGVVDGERIVDLDDLNDRLLYSAIDDRTARHGRLATAALNWLHRLEAPRWATLHRRIAGEVRLVTVCSEEDVLHLGVANAAIVPNGYPEPHAVSGVASVEPPVLFFIGPLSYEPNLLAVTWMAFEVMPLLRQVIPDAQLVVAGYHHGVPDRLHRAEGVTLLGYAHDLAAHYSAASVAVTPLQSGGGTRLKVIEALARGVPLVSTSFGCAGLGLTHDRELLIADDPESFAEACVALIRDRQLAGRLTSAGLATFRERLTAQRASGIVADVARAALTDQPLRASAGHDA